MKTRLHHATLATVLIFLTAALHAQVPQLLNYQGRVAVGNPAVNFDGSGQFRFALVNAAGNTTYWSNDGTSVGGAQPTAAGGCVISHPPVEVSKNRRSQLGCAAFLFPARVI